MPLYVEKAVKWFQHPPPIVLQDQLHQHVKKTYSAKVQHTNLLGDSPPLNKAGKKFIQEVPAVFLYLTQAVDSTMLTMLSAIASAQAAPTEKTMQKCLQFVDYPASQEDAIVTYQARNMRLAIHSDALYLSEPRARSRAGSHMFMAGTEDILINNGAVLNILLAALFINAKTAVSMQSTLEEMEHPQTCTTIQTNNSTAHALQGALIGPRRPQGALVCLNCVVRL